MKTISKAILFEGTTPHEVFEAIWDPAKHSDFTGAEATNEQRVGGRFSAWDNYIFGKNKEFEQDVKIVQSWTCTDFRGEMTEVTFQFNSQGANTMLIFTQKGIPDKNYKQILHGWKDFYWKPLEKYLARNKK